MRQATSNIAVPPGGKTRSRYSRSNPLNKALPFAAPASKSPRFSHDTSGVDWVLNGCGMARVGGLFHSSWTKNSATTVTELDVNANTPPSENTERKPLSTRYPCALATANVVRGFCHRKPKLTAALPAWNAAPSWRLTSNMNFAQL